MAVLIAVRSPDGALITRCDHKCYDARTDNCQCVCGGRLHGLGLRRAAARLVRGIRLELPGGEEALATGQISVHYHRRLQDLAQRSLFGDDPV